MTGPYRRLAAIMFTDMVGYTALGQKNESLSLALVKEQRSLLRPIFNRHNGRAVKTIGDAFLVEFPSALEAVRCAYDIQRATREFNISLPQEKRIHLRVGVHLGDVVESQGDISGDAVNVASRIESLAEKGGVCLTRQVYDQVQNKFELPLKNIGLKSLKNVSSPVEAYKIVMPWEEDEVSLSSPLDMKRIAVLPFANMSPDPNDDYFADGMTEELITTLSALKELTVIARTSVMRYKSAVKPVSEIGKELNTGTLIEGSVRKSGHRVRITVQLIDAVKEGHLWAQNYDKQLDDIFAIQSDVAKQVAEALQIKLLSADKKKLEKPPTSNMEAYTLYLKGRFYEQRTTEESYRKAIGYYDAAVTNDPHFALAYVGLASSYSGLGFYGMMPSTEAGSKAREFAEKALSLDASLAEAHLVMGRILRNYDWDFAGAEREYKRAIELNPSLAEAHGAKAILLLFNKHFSEAISEAKRSSELDPSSGVAAQQAGVVYLYQGRQEEAIDELNRALKIDPENAFARGNLGLAYVQRGMFDVGIEEMRKVATIKNPSSQSDLAYAYAKAGRVEELKKLLEELLKEAELNHELAVAVACAYANLGDSDRAFEWLDRAYDDRIAFLTSTNADFAFDSIRSDSRFQALMKKIGYTNT